MTHLEEEEWFVYAGQPMEDIPRDVTHMRVHPSANLIQERAFSSCHFLRIIEIEMAQTIGTLAFCNCCRLAEIRFGSALREIGEAAFAGCSSLAHLALPEGLRRIEEEAFSHCSSLSEIAIPSGVAAVGGYAFNHCTSLTEVQFCLPSDLRSIGEAAFESCVALTAVALPRTLEELGDKAFFGCFGLFGIEIPSHFGASFGENCFASCRALVNISICNSVHAPNNAMFEGCNLLAHNANVNCPPGRSPIQDRFANLPVHSLCYYTNSFIPAVIAGLPSNFENGHFVDAYGMTPFHILATSANPNVNGLQFLLDRYPVEVWEHRDNHGSTMMNYLFDHTSSKSVPSLKMMLERTIVEKLKDWGPAGKHHWELWGLLERIQVSDDIGTRRKRIRAFFRYVGQWYRHEMTSLLDLALWKVAIKAHPSPPPPINEYDHDHEHRADCRIQSRGADVVMENVIPYLWGNDEPRAFAALWLFPVWYSNTITNLDSPDDNLEDGGDFDSEYEYESVSDSELSFDSLGSD
ncbi:MAG: hypothetical protein SGBAC_006399 [Bacillariaceae sp.]